MGINGLRARWATETNFPDIIHIWGPGAGAKQTILAENNRNGRRLWLNSTHSLLLTKLNKNKNVASCNIRHQSIHIFYMGQTIVRLHLLVWSILYAYHFCPSGDCPHLRLTQESTTVHDSNVFIALYCTMLHSRFSILKVLLH